MRALQVFAGLKPRVLRLWPALRCAMAITIAVGAGNAHAQVDADFRCDGKIESDVWTLWDTSARRFLRDEMVFNRLKKAGDTYALYDIQVYAQNLVEMAVRCGRGNRLKEIAELVDLALDEMTDPPEAAPRSGKRWICRGGRVCNATNKLLDTEIALNSQQFLTFAMRVARALAAARDWPADRRFVERVTTTATYHLQRWTGGKDALRLAERMVAKPADVRDGQSRLFFTDQDLWVLDIAAEVAGVLAVRPELSPALPNNGLAGDVKRDVIGLLELLSRRVVQLPLNSPVIGQAVGADIDRGFWRLYRDSRYAGYEGAEKPAECVAGRPASVRVAPDKVRVVDTIGWDFSHARRLVHVTGALERNRAALRQVFDVPDRSMPPVDLPRQFAAQLIAAVWNGDRDQPLFANYWNGTNGWYRVAYDIGLGSCLEGYAPSMLSDAFVTGGFVTWGARYPVIGELGQRVYKLSQSNEPPARQFIETYYGQLAAKASANNRMLTQLMFWPSLVQWSNPS